MKLNSTFVFGAIWLEGFVATLTWGLAAWAPAAAYDPAADAAGDVFLRVEIAAGNCLETLNDEMTDRPDAPILPNRDCVLNLTKAGLEYDARKHCGDEMVSWLP
jgi:hypothetical protein